LVGYAVVGIPRRLAPPVLKYSKFIHPIVPEVGPSPGGMKRISPAAVMERVAPLLARVKNPK
jgi:hypothetical protein